MKKIYLKFKGKPGGGFHNQPRAWFALGDHAIDAEQTHLLSPSCCSLGEVEEQAAYLKGLIEGAVENAKRKFRN